MNEQRLAALALLPRVWDYVERENQTVGLIELCREWIKPDYDIVEIGCFAGVSTCVFAEFAENVYAVDPWMLATEYTQIPREKIATAEKQFDERTAEYVNIHKVRNFSIKAATFYKRGAFNAVYIDGDHTFEAVAQDIAAWKEKIKPGGLLMGHDYGSVRYWLPGKPEKVYSDSSWVIQL